MKRYKNDTNPATGKFELPVMFDGKLYTVFKREQSKLAPWYVRLQRHGKDVWMSLGTADPELASNKAKSKIEAVLVGNEELLARTRLREPLAYALVEQVCAEYKRVSTVIRPAHPVNSLLNFLRRAGLPEPVGTLTVDRLTPKVVRDFQGNAVAAIRARDLGEDEYRDALWRAQYSANSIWTQAKSVFTPAMMSKYRDAGLSFPPAFADFVRAPKIGNVVRPSYSRPHDALVERTIRAAGRVATHAARLRFVGAGDLKDQRTVLFMLELGCGLRNAVATAARGSSIGQINGKWVFSFAPRRAKNKKPRSKRIPVAFARYIADYMLRRQIGPDDLLLPRGSVATRAISRWMRLLGWQTRKTNHALRAYSGYLVFRDRGPQYAQAWLDHGHFATTQASYVGVMSAEDVELSFDELTGARPAAEQKIVPMQAANG